MIPFTGHDIPRLLLHGRIHPPIRLIGDTERFSPRVELERMLRKRRLRATVHSRQAARAGVNGLKVQPERKRALGVLRP